MKKHIIYDNYDIYTKEAMNDAKECYLEADYKEDEITEEMLYNEIDDSNQFWFEDEFNMLKNIDSECGQIIAIANIGRWNGRCSGYKEYDHLEDIMYSNCDYETIYVDGYNNLRKDESHHDGSNYILYRQWKDGITDIQRDNFLNKCYNGTVTCRDISRYTKNIGSLISKEYGW